MASPVQLKVLLDLSDGVTFNETSNLCFDISDIIISAHTRRGRNREIDKIQAGYAVITVVDENGYFNPDNPDSPYYGRLIPGRKIRLYPEYNDGSGNFRYPNIFTGYITNYNLNFAIGLNAANEVTIETYDALRLFNSVSITNVVNATTDDTSDERINAILDEIAWPSSLRMFETSALQLDADQGDLRTVFDAIRQVEDTEAGLFYIDGSGVAQFKNRTSVNTLPDLNNAYKFSDNGVDTSYNALQLIQDDAMLYNKVTVRSYDGTNEVTVSSTTSIDTYLTRSAERNNVLLSTTNELEDLANVLLAQRETSSLQIQSITLNLSDYEVIDRVIAALYFEIFFIPVNVEKTLAGNTFLSRLGWVQGVNHDITQHTWTVTAFTGLTEFTDVATYVIGAQAGTSNNVWSTTAVDVSGYNIYTANLGYSVEDFFMVYAKGKWVSFCINASNQVAFAYSYNGYDWIKSSNVIEPGPIIYAGNQFVALVGSQCAVSSDGINWTFDDMPIDNVYTGVYYHYWNGIAYGNNKYVAINREGYAAHSTDGLTWTFGEMAVFDSTNQLESGWPTDLTPGGFLQPLVTQYTTPLCYFSWSYTRFGPQYVGGTPGNNALFYDVTYGVDENNIGRFIITLRGAGTPAGYCCISEDGETWRVFPLWADGVGKLSSDAGPIYHLNDQFWLPNGRGITGDTCSFTGEPIETTSGSNVYIIELTDYTMTGGRSNIALSTKNGNDEIWLLGATNSGGLTDMRIWKSSDGIDWTEQQDVSSGVPIKNMWGIKNVG
jgi:hypothetical protein